MCQLCGEFGASVHAIALSERPSHRLAGRYWEGGHEAAARGALLPLIEQAKTFSAGLSGLWKSPIVSLSWNDRPGGFRQFVGVAVEEGERLEDGMETLELPDMTLASSWHGPDDGSVVEHYGRMLGWVRERGLEWDRSRFHQREEYPPDIDLSGPLALRLLIPLVEGPARR